MQRWKKNLLGVATILVGLGLARLFGEPPQRGQEPVAPPEVARRLPPLNLQVTTTPEVSPAWEAFSSLPSPSVQPPAVPARVSLEDLKTPPELAPQFETLERPLVRLSPTPRALMADESDDPDEEESRLHRVADGDTLPSLAQRYYGDSRLWRKLWDANADAISAPELLPVGLELTIPPLLRDRETSASTESVPTSPAETSSPGTEPVGSPT